MILLGRVYQGLMVDVQAIKPRSSSRRSEEMLVRLAACDREAARDALRRATAASSWPSCCSTAAAWTTALRLIEEAGGRLRAALAILGRRGTDAA